LKQLISALAPTVPGEATPLIVSVMLSQQSGRVFSYWIETTEDLHCRSAQNQRILLSSSLLKNLEMGVFLFLPVVVLGWRVDLDVIFQPGVGRPLTRGG
jgi:hypothetical protein